MASPILSDGSRSDRKQDGSISGPFFFSCSSRLFSFFRHASGRCSLFIGNSFTYGATAPAVQKNGGVPKLFEAISLAKGHHVATTAVTAGGKDWSYHLGRSVTAKALGSQTWTWVVLQDFSTRPTRAGDVKQFLQDGETFSTRIAQNSPKAGIVLFETWARPPCKFSKRLPGNLLSGPDQMMGDLHDSYGKLRDNLAAENKNRAVRVALVGTAFMKVHCRYPGRINL